MCFIRLNIYNDIVNTIGKAPIESGGIIGIKNGIICKYFFDNHNFGNHTKYIPNTVRMNRVIKEWHKSSIEFAGIIHSHPLSCFVPSLDDFNYAYQLMKANPFLNMIIFPIVTRSDKKVKITFYEFRNGFFPIKVTIV